MKATIIELRNPLWVLMLTWILSEMVLRAADPALVSLTRGPYVQMTTKTSAILRWRTDEAAFSQVWIGRRPDDLETEFLDFEMSIEHRMPLRNLVPGTRYYYAIGDAVGQLGPGRGVLLPAGVNHRGYSEPYGLFPGGLSYHGKTYI